jgi:adenine-specific DNA-methyltransferase
MALNAEDGGSRQCILVTNNENNICEEVTYERNKRVIEGYTNAKGEAVAGLGGNNLRYYRTGYVPKASDENTKRLLTQSCTDLLCIKENCYEDITAASGFEAIKTRVFKTEANGNTPEKYMIVVYHSRQSVAIFKQLKAFINALETSEKIRVYAFSAGKDSLEAELIDVADKIEAVPLPDAIVNAYNACLRRKVSLQD